MQILSSNRDNVVYNKFLQGHKLPEPLYFFEGKLGAELLNFNQLLQQPNLDKNIQDIFEEEVYNEKSINLVLILKTSRHVEIAGIVECLRKTSINARPVKIMEIRKRSVSFFDTVIVYPLVKPQYIFFAKRKQCIPISFEQQPLLRTFRSITGLHFCDCNKCRVHMSQCGADRCISCF